MASDVKRTVEVAIKVTGIDNSQLGKLASNFETIAKAVDKVSSSLNILKANLEGLKPPKNLNAIADSIKEISGIKVPNIKQIAEGFERLGKIKTPPDLSNFASEVERFSKIKVPNINALVIGLKNLTDSTLSMNDVGSRLRVVYRNLKRFSDIRLPNISLIVKGFEELNKVAGINIQNKSLSALADSLRKLDGLKTPNLSTFVKGLKSLEEVKLGETERKLTQLSAALNQFSERKLPSITGLVNGLKKLVEVDVGKVVSKIRELNDALKLLDKAGYLNSFKSFASDLDRVSRALNQATSNVDRSRTAFNGLGTAAKSASKNIQTLGDRIRNYLQYRLIADATMNLREAFFSGIEAIGQYDQALKDLQAITGATSHEVDLMGKKIKEVASGTKFSAQEVAEGMRTLGQAGFSASESIQTMQAVSDLATGTLSDMKTTVDLVTTAMRVFGIEASRSGEVSDVFANAVNRSKLTIDKLRTAMNYVGPIAKSAGVSFEELSASMMTLANSGLRASTIGTGLRRVFAELADPSDKLADATQRAGIALSELDTNSNSLETVISNLGIVVSDTQTAFDLFGKRGAAAVLALTDSEGQFKSMLTTVSKSGTAAKMAEIQMEGLAVSFKNLKDKLGLLAVSLGEAGIAGAFRIIIDLARSLVDVLTVMLNSPLAKFLVTATLATTAIYGIVTAFQALTIFLSKQVFAKLVVGISSLAGVSISAQTAVAGLAIALNPLFLVLAAGALTLANSISSLGDAKKEMRKAAEEASEFETLSNIYKNYTTDIIGMKEESDDLKQANIGLRAKLVDTATGLSEISDEAAEAAKQIHPLTGELLDGGEALKKYNDELNKLTLDKLVKSAESSFGALDSGTNQLSRSWLRMKDSFTSSGSAMIGSIEGIWNAFDMDMDTNAIQKIMSSWSDWAKEGRASQAAKEFAESINDGSVKFQELYDYVATLDMRNLTSQQQVVSDSFDSILERATPLFEKLKQIVKVDTNYTVTQMQTLLEKLGYSSDLVSVLIAKFEKLKAAELDGFSNIIEKWGNDLKNTSDNIPALIQGARDVGVALTNAEKARLAGYEASKKGLADQLQGYAQEREVAIQSGKDKLEAWNTYYAQERALLKKARTIRLSETKDEILQTVQAINVAMKKRDEAIAKNESRFSDMPKALAKANSEVLIEYTATINKIKKITIDPKDLIKSSRSALEELRTVNKKVLYDISVDEANGVISHEQAEIKKLSASIAYQDARLTKARETLVKLQQMEAEGEIVDQAQMDKALDDIEKEEQARLDVRLKAMQKYGTEYRKAKEKLKTEEAKQVEEIDKHEKKIISITDKASKKREEIAENYSKKRKTIADTLATKIVDINQKLYEKLKDFTEKRVDAEKAASSEIAGLNDSLEDKLRSIRQRGMSDNQKDRDNRRAADKKLRDGQKAIDDARRSGDEDALARGKSLLEGASSLYEGLKSSNKAESGVRRVIDALKEASGIKLELDLSKISEDEAKAKTKAQNDINTAKNLHDVKMTAIETEKNLSLKSTADKLQVSLSAEDDRHAKVMSNITKEIAEFRKQMSETQKLLTEAQTTATTPKDTTAGAKDSKKVENPYPDIKEDAYKAKQAIDAVADSMGVVRKEGETDVQLQLRINNIKETTAAIEEITKKENEISLKPGIKRSPWVPLTEGIKTIITDLNSISDQVDIEIDIKIKDDKIDQIKEKAKKVDPIITTEESKSVRVKMDVSEFDSFMQKLKSVSKTSLDISVRLVGIESIDTVRQWMSDPELAQLNITVDVSGDEQIVNLHTMISEMTNKLINIVAEVTGLRDVIKLYDAIDKLKDKTVTVTTNFKTTGKQYNTGGFVSLFADGGIAQQFADGGNVFKRLADPLIKIGSGFKDDVPAMLTRGEFVHIPEAVSHYGIDFMRSINNLSFPKPSFFANGGIVGTNDIMSNTEQAGIINLNLDFPTEGPPINVQTSSDQFDELMQQLTHRKRFAS